MAEISAAAVMKLRRMSGQGMMDCKKALTETNGDIEEALTLLRKKGMATLEKRAGRDTTQGRVISCISGDGKLAVLASLCCETDFVANSEDFKHAATLLEEYAMACSADSGAENIAGTEINGKKFSEVINDAVSKTGEKIELGDYARFEIDGNSVAGTYVHFNNSVGAMVEIEADSEAVAGSDELKTAAAEVAMHVTAAKPMALDESAMDPEVVAREKEVAAEQMKNKPANIVEKIVEGKMKKFFADHCLVDQPFVRDDKKSVREVVAEAAKKAGGTASIKRFVRFEIG